MKKVKGLTLMEVLVAMIIGAIVITAAGFAFEIFVNKTINFKKLSKTTNDIQKLSTILSIDMLNASIITKETDYSFKISNTNKELIYEINPTYTVRMFDNIKDTFFLKNESFEFKFVQDTSGTNNSSCINKIILKYMLDGEKEACIFNKQYDADKLIQAEAQANK
jgi:prepilin-type N-terminal cleavage/methylation domain-containing protein